MRLVPKAAAEAIMAEEIATALSRIRAGGPEIVLEYQAGRIDFPTFDRLWAEMVDAEMDAAETRARERIRELEVEGSA